MNPFVEIIRYRTFLLCCMTLAFIGSSVFAVLPLNLSGNMDISYGESNINSNNQELFQQKYSFNWSKNILSQLSLRSTYSYSKINLTQNSNDPIWQKRQLPLVNLVWNNSIFTMNAGHSYRTTDATLKNLQVSSKDWSFYFKTKSIKYPKLSFRANKNHNYNHTDMSIQNLFENRYQVEFNQSFKSSSVYYSFTRRINENRINNFKSTHNSHSVRFNDMKKFFKNKVSISTNYSMSYQRQTDERRIDTTDYFVLQTVAGLFSQTNNFTLDSLSQERALTDGNTQDIIIPIIDIGGTSLNHNIGVDFGYNQNVDAMYLYLNQYTDKRMWQVYTSSNNINWNLHATSPNVNFNNGYNRLEIVFPTILTRYIKIVNLDVSEIEHAYVTEIQALEEREMTDITHSNSSSHYADMRTTYTYSERISSMANLSYQYLPGQLGSNKRENISYSLSTRFKQSDKLSHNFRWQQNKQYLHGFALDQTEFGANYLMNYKPLEKLEFTLSTNTQVNYIDDMKNTQNNSYSLNSRSTPLSNLQMNLELTYSKNKQNISQKEFETWNQRISFDGNVTRSISIVCSYSHRNSKFNQPNSTAITSSEVNRDLYLVGARYRVSKTIFVRSSINLNKSNSSYFSQDYMLSWTPSTKLSINSQMRVQDDNNIKITKRYNTQLNYKLGRNANIYISYLITDLTNANGNRNKSIRAGFRSGL